MEFRTAYGPKRRDVVRVTKGETLTRQAMKEQSDINVIMAQYQKSGLITHVNRFQGDYGDVAEMDFHEAMNTVTAAQEMFGTVPSEIRARFANDPGAFLDFVTDPRNAEEMREMGLLPKSKDFVRDNEHPEHGGEKPPPQTPANQQVSTPDAAKAATPAPSPASSPAPT